MGIRDLEMLEAKAGNHGKYNRVSKRLQQYANSIALALFDKADSVIREEIVQKAMIKVSDWLSTDGVLHADHPWAYAKRIIHNTLFDYARAKKGKTESVSFTDTLFAGVTVMQEMAWIDEGFAKIVEEGDENYDHAATGWRLFKISDDLSDSKRPEKSSEHPQIHPWLQKLEEIIRDSWWEVPDTNSEGLSLKEVKNVFTERTSKLWSKYNLISALIDNITSQSEKKVILHYLWGFKAVEIAKKLKVSKSYISKVQTKWFGYWGWNDDDIAQARMIFLTKNLADWYKKYLAEMPSLALPPKCPEYPERYNPREDELYDKLSQCKKRICESMGVNYEEYASYYYTDYDDDDSYDEADNKIEIKETIEAARKYRIENKKYDLSLHEVLIEIRKPSGKEKIFPDVTSKIDANPEIDRIYQEIEEQRDRESQKEKLQYDKAHEIYKQELITWEAAERDWKADISKYDSKYYTLLTTSEKTEVYFHDLDLSGINHLQLSEIGLLRNLMNLNPDDCSTYSQLLKLLNLEKLEFITKTLSASWYPNIRWQKDKDITEKIKEGRINA